MDYEVETEEPEQQAGADDSKKELDERPPDNFCGHVKQFWTKDKNDKKLIKSFQDYCKTVETHIPGLGKSTVNKWPS